MSEKLPKGFLRMKSETISDEDLKKVRKEWHASTKATWRTPIVDDAMDSIDGTGRGGDIDTEEESFDSIIDELEKL